jgi:hypothetical protein
MLPQVIEMQFDQYTLLSSHRGRFGEGLSVNRSVLYQRNRIECSLEEQRRGNIAVSGTYEKVRQESLEERLLYSIVNAVAVEISPGMRWHPSGLTSG